MCTGEGRDTGEHGTQGRVGAQVKAGTQVGTEHIGEGRDTGEHRMQISCSLQGVIHLRFSRRCPPSSC